MDSKEHLDKAKRVLESSTGESFSDIESSVLEDSYNKMTYAEMAKKHNFNESYLKTTGSELWKRLSFALKEDVSKRNIKQAIDRLARKDGEFIISTPKSNIEGVWEGNVFQSEFRYGYPINFGIRLELMVQIEKISGTMILLTSDLMNNPSFVKNLREDPYVPEVLPPEIEYEVNGFIHHNRFVNISYSPLKLRTRQFGFIILEDNGYQEHRLKGKFIGYGSISQGIVSGKMALKRS